MRRVVVVLSLNYTIKVHFLLIDITWVVKTEV